jgi:hypothetical protein
MKWSFVFTCSAIIVINASESYRFYMSSSEEEKETSTNYSRAPIIMMKYVASGFYNLFDKSITGIRFRRSRNSPNIVQSSTSDSSDLDQIIATVIAKSSTSEIEDEGTIESFYSKSENYKGSKEKTVKVVKRKRFKSCPF